MTFSQREELLRRLCETIVDDMDIKTLCACVYDYLQTNYEIYSDEEIVEEIREYYPHLLDEPDVEEDECNWSQRWDL